MKLFITFLISTLSLAAFSATKVIEPEGKISSPYEACKNVVIVGKEKYEENKSKWEKYEKTCNVKVQVAEEAGLSKLNPLKEGVQYLDFSQKVAKQVLNNLVKSQKYADCSAVCFAGAATCNASLSTDNKAVQCSERKKEILEGMNVFSRRIRMEMALSTDAPGLSSITPRNALTSEKEKFVNTNLRDFETVTPNPVGRSQLTPREVKEALRRVEHDHQQLEEEYKEKGYKNYSDWMAIARTKKFDEHREAYRNLIYQEAPIFAVIDGGPPKFDSNENPVWTDEQMAKAFKKLSDNSKETQKKVEASMKNSVLEFSRSSGEALAKWVTSKNDLLFYMGMKNQVEEVLKSDPNSCAIATSMEKRLHNKEMQNAGVTLVASFAAGGLIKGVSKGATAAFRIGRALTGAEAAGLTGLGLGASFLGDSFRQYNNVTNEAATLSGVGGDKEGTSIRTTEEVVAVRDGVKISLAFAPLDAAGGWAVGKSLYSALGKQMAKDLPAISNLSRKAQNDPVARDQLVDKWLAEKVKTAFKSGVLDGADKAALESNEAKKVLETLTAQIEKSNPEFFKNPKNVDFYLKTAATTVKKQKGDPSDLGEKATDLLLHFNTEAMNGSWDPKAQSGLLKVFDSAIEELRLASKNDPASYAKFATDQASRDKILMKALKRAGVKEADSLNALQCATPRV